MKIDLFPLDELREFARTMNKQEFMDQYPGVFLLAMGLLSSRPLEPKSPGTLPFVFDGVLRHKVESHPLAGLAFFLRSSQEQFSVVLGRASDCELTVPDKSVSERHCRLQVTDQGVQVVDLNSRNGTTINLARLAPDQPNLLGDEDILTLGRYSFQIMSAATCHAALRLLDTIENEQE
jgi:hypothetical protein